MIQVSLYKLAYTEDSVNFCYRAQRLTCLLNGFSILTSDTGTENLLKSKLLFIFTYTLTKKRGISCFIKSSSPLKYFVLILTNPYLSLDRFVIIDNGNEIKMSTPLLLSDSIKGENNL